MTVMMRMTLMTLLILVMIPMMTLMSLKKHLRRYENISWTMHEFIVVLKILDIVGIFFLKNKSGHFRFENTILTKLSTLNVVGRTEQEEVLRLCH